MNVKKTYNGFIATQTDYFNNKLQVEKYRNDLILTIGKEKVQLTEKQLFRIMRLALKDFIPDKYEQILYEKDDRTVKGHSTTLEQDGYRKRVEELNAKDVEEETVDEPKFFSK